MKVYTKNGDGGETSLVDGSKVDKGNLRLEAYGTSDELNAFVGLLYIEIQKNFENSKSISELLRKIQNDLFVVGGQLSCSNSEISKKLPSLNSEAISQLESTMDIWDNELPPLKNFILPGGTQASALTHICRTVTRRLERSCVRLFKETEFNDPLCVPYINRLSDFFFVLGRLLNERKSVSTPIWKPN